MTHEKSMWYRLHQYFIYPLTIKGIFLLFLYSTVITLLYNLSNFYLIIPIGLMLSILFLSYCFYIIKYSVSYPFNSLPSFFSVLNFDLIYFFNQLVIYLLPGVIVYYGLVLWTPFALIFALIVVTLLAPASLLILTHDKRLDTAINFLNVLKVIYRTSPDYFIAIFVFLLMETGFNTLFQLVRPKIPSDALVFMTSFLGLYLLLVFYRVIGMVSYFNKNKFSSEVVNRTKEHPKQQEESFLFPEYEVTQSYLQEGEIMEAAKIVANAIENTPNNLALHEYYHKILSRLAHTTDFIHHAQTLIDILLQHNNLLRASNIYESAINKNPEFVMEDLYSAYELANFFKETQKYHHVVSILKDFHLRYPHHPFLPKSYLLLSKVLNEHLHKQSEAKKNLLTIIQLLPHSPEIPEIKAYLKKLAGLD